MIIIVITTTTTIIIIINIRRIKGPEQFELMNEISTLIVSVVQVIYCLEISNFPVVCGKIV